MSFHPLTPQESGQYHEFKKTPPNRVNTFGQVAVRFHQDPKRLAHWFERAQKAPAIRGLNTKKRHANRSKHQTDLPAPRLNIAIHICGSRGDVQPFIPIAKLLQESPHGHRVRVCTHPAFKGFVEDNGLEFFSIGNDPEELMAYMVKNPGLLPGMESIKDGDIAQRRKGMAEMFEGTWRSCIEAGDGLGPKTKAAQVENAEDLFIADMIIANPPSMGHIHCAERLGIPLHIVFTMPWSPTKAFHHPLAAMEYGDVDRSVANYFSFAMMELLTWQGLGDLINRFRVRTLKLDPISPMWGFQLLQRLRVPHSYLWSQALIPKPSDWGSHLNVTGFSFLKLGSSYTPPEDLRTFLDSGSVPIYIGFGSIVVKDPVKLTNTIFEAVKLAGVRAIISKGWGGVGGDTVPENVYLIGNCPHDWLFQQVSCVVHHGGAGTTAAGIALGKPTAIVPFFGDQPFWGQMIAKAGAGPKPIPYKQMTAESLAEAIKFALREEVGVAVKAMAAQIAEEDGAGDTVLDIERALQVDDMRCHVIPERLAIWRDKQTGIHLSGLAACVLVEQHLIHPKQLRLVRHRHWYVHEGAETPTIGAIAAISGTFSTVTNSTKDFAERLKHSPARVENVESASQKPIDELTEREVTAGKLNSTQLEAAAWRLAGKTFHPDLRKNFNKPTIHQRVANVRARSDAKRAKRSRPHQIASATGHYVYALGIAGAKAPVAFFYNVANGFRNLPSYILTNEVHRRRDEITGLGTGLGVAGKEFVFGIGEAFGGIVRHPYIGARTEGPLGFGKGVGRGVGGFGCHILAAVFGLAGYSLKGIECALSRHRLTTLQAELILIRLRQTNDDYEKSTPEQRAEVVASWKRLQM